MMTVFLISDLESILYVAYVFLFFSSKRLSSITKLLETLGDERDFLLLLTHFKANWKRSLKIFHCIFPFCFLK